MKITLKHIFMMYFLKCWPYFTIKTFLFKENCSTKKQIYLFTDYLEFALGIRHLDIKAKPADLIALRNP